MENVVAHNWRKLYGASTERTIIMRYRFQNNGSLTDSTFSVIDNNLTQRGKFIDSCSIGFIKYEYDLNEIYLAIRDSLSSDTEMKFKTNDQVINNLVDEYNASVVNYNKYISLFPNFIFARPDFKTKKVFTLTYGQHNDDPVEQIKEVPQWMRDIEKKHGM